MPVFIDVQFLFSSTCTSYCSTCSSIQPSWWEVPSYNLPAFFGLAITVLSHASSRHSWHVHWRLCSEELALVWATVDILKVFARVSHVHCKMYGGSWSLCSQDAQEIVQSRSTGMTSTVSACTVQVLLPRSGPAYANSRGTQLASIASPDTFFSTLRGRERSMDPQFWALECVCAVFFFLLLHFFVRCWNCSAAFALWKKTSVYCGGGGVPLPWFWPETWYK